MKTLVFSRRNCIYSTVTRRQGLKTGTVSILRGNLSKSPKRPALPDAVKRGRAVPRHRPFLLLLFHTPPGALIRGFFNLAFVGPNSAFWGLVRVVSPLWGENRLTGPHGGQQRLSRSVLLGAKKPLPGFAWQRPVDCLIHLFSKNVPYRPHKRKGMRSVSWSVTRRKTGFPRIQAPT